MMIDGCKARTVDATIRELRAELHAERCKDKDHSDGRLFMDAQRLDLDLWLLGIPCKRTTWGNDPDKLSAQQAARKAAKQ